MVFEIGFLKDMLTLSAINNYYQIPQKIKMPRANDVSRWAWLRIKDTENRVVCLSATGKR